MALRDQPYLPLYIQDFITDEKLMECSAASTGVYIRIMCLMHKSEEYGKIKLKAKYKQIKSNEFSFAVMLEKYFPFNAHEIEMALVELVEHGVLYFEDDRLLCQKRMISDGDISIARASAGSKGGKIGRNSGTKRYYNEPGFLYLIVDANDSQAFKVGISAEPDKRIKGIARKTGRQNLTFRKKWKVGDMGAMEQEVLDYFNDIRDGEWIFGDYSVQEIESKIDSVISKNKSKTKANAEDENENEIVIDINKIIYPFDSESFKAKWIEWKAYRKENGKSYKGIKSEQAALNALKQFNEAYAIGLINQSIANSYQGLIFSSTKSDYLKYNGKQQSTGGSTDWLKEYVAGAKDR